MTKNPNPGAFFCGGGGGGGGADGYGAMNKRAAIFFTRHTIMTSSTERYSLVKKILIVFQIEGIVAIPSREDNSESMKVRVVILVCDTSSRHVHITVKYHDNMPKGFQVIERTYKCISNNQGEITQKV